MRSDVQEPLQWLDCAMGNLFQEGTSFLVGLALMSLNGDGHPLPAAPPMVLPAPRKEQGDLKCPRSHWTCLAHLDEVAVILSGSGGAGPKRSISYSLTCVVKCPCFTQFQSLP